MNAAIYLRISEDRTGQEAGVTRQREDCERRARDRGWQVVAVEKDNDVSAKGTRKRPGFERVLELIESGQVQVVIAWHIDRLQRNRRDEVRLYELCEQHKIIVSLVRGPDLEWETPTGRYLADNLGSLARLEIEQKSDRQKRAQAQAAKKGKRVGGRRPFGYEQDGMTIREKEAKAIYSGAQAVLMGETISDVARAWNAEGLTTGQGQPFTRSSVRDVLLNPRIAGLRAHVTVDDRLAAKGARVPLREHIVGPAAWKAIIDEGTWKAVVDVLTRPERRKSPHNTQSLLTGIARCSECGGTVHSGGATLTQRTARVYRCRTMAHVSRSAEPVERYVSDVIVAWLSAEDARELLTDHDRPDLGALREEAVTLRTRKQGAATAYAQGQIDLPQLITINEQIDARLTQVDAEMTDAGRVDILGPLVSAEDVQGMWESLPTSRRRAVIDMVALVIIHPPGRGTRTFRPETVEIIPRHPRQQ